MRSARELAHRLTIPAAPPLPPTRSSLAAIGEGYVNYQLNHGHAPKTVEKYTLALRTLSAWARRTQLRFALDLDQSRYWAFHRWMLDQGFSHKTRYDRLIVVKQMFKWAARTGLISSNPLAAADLIRKPSPTPAAVLHARAGRRAAGSRRRGGHAGVRGDGLRGAAVRVRDLRWSDLNFGRGTGGFIHVLRGGSGETTKSGRPRQIPMHPALREMLLSVPRRGERVFLCRWMQQGRGEWRPLVERIVLMSLKRLCRACGFEDAERFKLHSLRHAFCSMCARHNISYKYALMWLGHRDSQMLDYYYHAFDETAEAAIRTIIYPAPVPATDVLDYAI